MRSVASPWWKLISVLSVGVNSIPWTSDRAEQKILRFSLCCEVVAIMVSSAKFSSYWHKWLSVVSDSLLRVHISTVMLFVQNAFSVCLCLRTWALYSRRMSVLILMVASGGTLLAVSCVRIDLSRTAFRHHLIRYYSVQWSVVGQHETIDLNGGCHTALSHITYVFTTLWFVILNWTLIIND